jgi:hypothetical protein
MFDDVDGVKRALANMIIQRKNVLYFHIKLNCRKMCKHWDAVIPMKGMILISALILDSFHQLRSFMKWGKRIHISPEAETDYTTDFQQVVLK